MDSGWFTRARALPVVEVATALDLPVSRGRFPCPSCGADRGGKEDRRPPAGISRDGYGWRCHKCDVSGDGPALVAWRLLGRPADTPEDWRDVRAWFAGRGVPDVEEHVPGAPRAPLPLPPPVSVAPPERPPVEEVAGLWNASRRVDGLPANPDPLDMEAVFFLARRSYYPPDLAAVDVARLAPLDDYPWPDWWPATWAPWRLLTRAWSPTGDLVSVHARRVDSGEPRQRWPRGYASGGLLLAGPRGAAFLRGEDTDSRGAILVEGVTDLLRAELRIRVEGLPLVALGGTSGSFQALGSVRWPRGWPVFFAMDPDESGHRYEAQALEALAGRPDLDLRRLPLGR